MSSKAARKRGSRGSQGVRALKFLARTKCPACVPISITVEVPRRRRPTPALREDVRFIAAELAAPQLKVVAADVVLTPVGQAALGFMGAQ